MTIMSLGKCFGKRKRQESCSSSDDIVGLSTQKTAISCSDGEPDVRSYTDSKPSAAPTVPSLLTLGPDAMVSVVSFLDPRETLNLLTMPLCREWHRSYTADQDLWRTICCTDPFSADLSKNNASNNGYSSESTSPHIVSCYDDIDDDNSFCSLNGNDVFGEYRLIYTSFVRCMNYLDRVNIKDGRNYGFWHANDTAATDPVIIFPTFGVTKSLKKFLSRNKEGGLLRSVIGMNDYSSAPIGISSDGREIQPFSKKNTKETGSPKPKFGNSMITNRLWGPTTNGVPSHLNLPKSCAIYSIVNWMVAHPNVKGIQIMCIQSLPPLLEDEQQRITAQRVGLVEVILCAMLRFPDCVDLHIAVFHAIVLLARPIGGREGMLFDNSMADTTHNIGLTSTIELTDSVSLASRCGGLPSQNENSLPNHGRDQGNKNGTSGIAILIDSMERFASSEKLQSMACWALVNVALVPLQKNMLMRLRGIEAILKAMKNHPKSFDVQFRALFALINLVVPCRPSDFSDRSFDGDEAARVERAVLNKLGCKIAQLSVSAMKNFCSSKDILNRGCLVVHNLSQSTEFMATLLETPHCYQILEWCVTNYSTDNVLRRSVSSTLHRMQLYLDEHPEDQMRFSIALERQNEDVLEQLW